MRAVSIACMALLMAGSAHAQKKKIPPAPAPQERVWMQEPDAVLGVKLGRPIGESGLPDCPNSGRPTEICLWTNTYPAIVQRPPDRYINGHPLSRTAVTYELDGDVVTKMLFKLPHFAADEMRDVLVTRYGPPTDDRDEPVQNGAGATFPNRTMSWTGKRITIIFAERFGTVNDSIVIITDNASFAKASEAKRDKAQGAASKL